MRGTLSALVIAVPLALGLAACAGGGGPPKPDKRQMAVIDRALARAPGAAQPSTIVAAELAFSRAARERGQWTAYRMYAAPGALLHGASGPFPIEPWVTEQTDPATAAQWSPRAVAISCDGALAVSQGRLRDADGKIGNFLTVWERQANGEYRYVFDASGPDVPQPPPRQVIEEGNIVVTALDAVLGLIASCPRSGAAIPPPPAIPVGEEGKADARLSRDGTLRWLWEHREDGARFAAVDYFYEGRWQRAFDQTLLPAGAP